MMFSDNRFYPRTKVTVPAILHEKTKNGEISCTVRDICEKGVCFEIPANEKLVGKLRTGDSIHFQFIDSFQYGKENETDILSNECLIRYVKDFGNFIRIGCYVSEKSFTQYAIRREVVSCFSGAAV